MKGMKDKEFIGNIQINPGEDQEHVVREYLQSNFTKLVEKDSFFYFDYGEDMAVDTRVNPDSKTGELTKLETDQLREFNLEMMKVQGSKWVGLWGLRL